MRLRHAAALPLGLTTAVAAIQAAAVPAAAQPAPTALVAPAHAPAPSCGTPSAHAFPIRTHVHGGPAAYRAGGGSRTWFVDLTNTTRKACRGVHPVIVLTDKGRSLRASQVTLELVDEHGGLRTLPLATTDEAEVIGVLAKDTTGFSVPAGKTVTVRARLAFSSGAPRAEVVVSAAAVQRKGGDGEWVGESNLYRFKVVDRGADVGASVPDGDGETAAGDREADSSGTAEPGTATADTGSGRADTPKDTTAGGHTGTATAEPPEGTASSGVVGNTARPGLPPSSTTAPSSSSSTTPSPSPSSARATTGPDTTGPDTATQDGQQDAAGTGAVDPGAVDPDTGAAVGPGSGPSGGSAVAPDAGPAVPELAATGTLAVIVRTAIAAALIGAGVALIVFTERRSRRSRS
jgi:hypothetical protein